VDALLHEFGLAPFTKRYPRQLSGGMKQRLAIVRALASEPDILLMDEPFSSLDALSREDAQDFLYAFTRTLRKTHPLTVILVTHSIEEAAYLADRIYVMTGRNPGTISACIDVPQSADAPAADSAAPPLIPTPDTSNPNAARSDRASPRFQELCAKVRAVLAESRRETSEPREETAPVRRRAPFPKLPGIIIALLGITVLWALAAALVNRPFLPGPLETARALVKIGQSGILARHTEASFSRIFWALLTASLPAAALGIAAGRNPRFAAFFSPILYIIHPLPKAAFLPVILLFLGLGEISKIFLIGFIVFSQILIAVRDTAGRIPPNLIDSVRSLGGGQGSGLRHVIIPAILPAFFTTLRVSLGTAAAVLFLAETFATDSGLGYLIVDAWTRISYPEMYAAITALSLLALLLFGALDLIERLVCPWQ
jgi:NitT/TauT family transport system permease protein